MDPKNKSSLIRTFVIGITALGCGGTLLWSGSATRQVLARSPNKSVSRPHKATLRVSDSPDACRVIVTADQPLNSYEAYRRGDRFYVKIPITSVPAADTVRGQAFSDVRVEQTPGGTIISFHLHADASARVDQRGSKIEIVFLVSRPRLARSVTANRAFSNSSVKRATQNDVNQNPKARIASKANKESTSKTVLATRPAIVPNGASAGRHNGRPRSSESARTANAQKQEAPSVKTGLATTAKKPTVTAQTANTETNSAGVNVKESANSWFSLLQVNRLVGLGVGLLLSLFGLVFLKRRTTKTRSVPTEAKPHDAADVETVTAEVTATVTT
jgi:hypothetical protein